MLGTAESVERVQRWWESDDRREGDDERVFRFIDHLDRDLAHHTHHCIELLSARGEQRAFLLGDDLVSVVEFFVDGDQMVYDILSLYRDDGIEDRWSLP